MDYALKAHRKDEFIEWTKSLLTVPFVLHAGSSNHFRIGDDSRQSAEARRRYAEIFRDLEQLIADQIYYQSLNDADLGRLRQMVPSVGHFFTRLPLERAFYVQDEKRALSKRRMVAPSFNDVRLILNTAQAMALAKPITRLELATFDGDVTLYEDGANLEEGSPQITRILALLERGVAIGIVTAAGYPDPSGKMYLVRFGALIDAVLNSNLDHEYKANLLVMGGECNYLFRLDPDIGGLRYIDREEWALDEMLAWREDAVSELLDKAEQVLKRQIEVLSMTHTATLYRKERSIGMIPLKGKRIPRENLEEVVLNVQHSLSASPAAKELYFCAFNGGHDVWVDVGDKRFGVLCLQRYLGGIAMERTLHVGDQFASIGSNDFKARLVAATVWIADPQETVEIIDELVDYLDESNSE